MSDEKGTAILLSLVIVSVLFILASFLIRRVVTNTMMVKKTQNEQASYTLAKEGILYVVDKLNTAWESSPTYNPTDWPGNSNWNDYNLDNDPDTGDSSGNDVRLRVNKDTPSGYITIECEDLPKKLVTLQGIAKSGSPLLEYVRFINSDTIFGDNMFGEIGSGAICQGDAPFCVLGDLTWESGSGNNLILTGDNKALVAGKIINAGTTSLQINSALPDSGYYYFFDPDNSSYNEPRQFDTARGHYFSGAHLPSCYDYSGGSGETPSFYYGAPPSFLWPLIEEERYKNLVGGTDSNYYISGAAVEESINWYDITKPGWIDDRIGLVPSFGSTQSATYTSPTAILIVLDGNGESSGTKGQIGIDDGQGGETPADNEISPGEWRAYPANGVIYSPGNLRVSGVIGDELTPTDYNLTIVSGDTIYIESNLAKGTSGSSVALLAKNYVTLNTTHRFINEDVVDTFTAPKPDSWVDTEKIRGEEDAKQMYINVSPSQIDWTTWPFSPIFQLDVVVLGLGQEITAEEIILKNCDFEPSFSSFPGIGLLQVYGSNSPSAIIDPSKDKLFGEPWTILTFRWDPTHEEEIAFKREEGFLSFKYIKILLINFPAPCPSFTARFDAVEVPLSEVNALSFAEENCWAVIPGNLPAAENYPFMVKGVIAENKFEQMDNWSSKWPQITYAYDSNLSSYPPPHLPSPVILVSLNRK